MSHYQKYLYHHTGKHRNIHPPKLRHLAIQTHRNTSQAYIHFVTPLESTQIFALVSLAILSPPKGCAHNLFTTNERLPTIIARQ